MLRPRITYSVLLLVVCAFYIFFDSRISLLAVLLFLLLPVVFFILLLAGHKKIQFELALDSPVVSKGHLGKLRIGIHCKTPLMNSYIKVYLNIRNTFLEQEERMAVLLPLDSGNSAMFSTGIRSDFCGNVEVSIEKIRVYDTLGLFFFSRHPLKAFTVTFLPDFHEIDASLRLAKGEDMEGHLFSEHKSGDDPSQVFDYHEYRDGDHIKNIHWKLSSRLSKYLVKELSLPISSNVSVLLEIAAQRGGRDTALLADAGVEVGLSLLMYLLQHDIHPIFEWFDAGEGCNREFLLQTQDDIYLAMEGLFRSAVHRGSLLLEERVRQWSGSGNTHCFYVTTVLSEDTLNQLVPVRSRMSVTVLYVHAAGSGISNALTLALSEAGISFVPIQLGLVREGLQGISL